MLADKNKARKIHAEIISARVGELEAASEAFRVVRTKGLEPPLPFGNQNLNLARLPISPRPQRLCRLSYHCPGAIGPFLSDPRKRTGQEP
mgnify:CR=1 FL=1